MMTVALVILVSIALLGIIGGFAMMFEKGAGWFGWLMGYYAMTSGLELIVRFGGELLSCLNSLNE
jgi:hypothetical protein